MDAKQRFGHGDDRLTALSCGLRPAKKDLMAVLPEHQSLPVWKHSGSKRERFAAVYCEVQRKGDPSQGVASHGECEG